MHETSFVDQLKYRKLCFVMFDLNAINKFAQMKEKKQKSVEKKGRQEKELYDLSTPLWDKYYQKVRSSVRFPRYYKESLNW